MSTPTLDAIVWNEKLMTGIPEIDEQHMILVHTLNDAAVRLSSEFSLELLQQITQDLLSYALYHFETEEELMHEYGYEEGSPEDAGMHLMQHRNFSAKVVAVREDLKAGILIPAGELVDFLSNWLVNHILNTDMRLAAFIRAKRAV